MGINKQKLEELKSAIDIALSQEFNYSVHPRDAAEELRKEANYYRAFLRIVKDKLGELGHD